MGDTPAPFWKQLTSQDDLDAQHNFLLARSDLTEKQLAMRLARFAEARIYIAAERHIEAIEAALAALKAEHNELRRIIQYIDHHTPVADHTCDEPGIAYSEAIRRTLKDERVL